MPSAEVLHLEPAPRFCNVVQTPLEKIETLKHESFRGSTLYKQQADVGRVAVQTSERKAVYRRGNLQTVPKMVVVNRETSNVGPPRQVAVAGFSLKSLGIHIALRMHMVDSMILAWSIEHPKKRSTQLIVRWLKGTIWTPPAHHDGWMSARKMRLFRFAWTIAFTLTCA